MRHTVTRLVLSALVATALPYLAWATDVDGTGDCGRIIRDFGDAPEGFAAYSTGVVGHFPTCIAASPAGSQSSLCAPPISTIPGLTGFVLHEQQQGGYWLGCGTSPLDDGIDTESDGKTSLGAAISVCSGIPVDCPLPAFGMTFGQDECYGGSDAGISALSFVTCASSTVTFDTFNCGPSKQVLLNILVDWNHDGDWNDNGGCPTPGSCWYEWSVKNVAIVLPTGCATLTSPAFIAGSTPGESWLRITISDTPAPEDFPWNGSFSVPGAPILKGGETEDYPVSVQLGGPGPCNDAYQDFGDAPEADLPGGLIAYPAGVLGHFPTCTYPGVPGTQEIECGAALSTPPGPTGHVLHFVTAADPHFWLGCGLPPPGGIDGEINGKVNLSPVVGDPSRCDPGALTDCVEPAFGMTFGQDECYGDAVDAGVSGPIEFPACLTAEVPFRALNCGPARHVYLNICVDWNHDGDWNDVLLCTGVNVCAPEWAVKNFPMTLNAGCDGYVSPVFNVGMLHGPGWMRVTLTGQPVLDDFPWNGSLGEPNGIYPDGETEDYPVKIVASSVGVNDPVLPGELQLAIEPNPSWNGATVHFVMPREGPVELAVYDIAGRKLHQLASGTMTAGEHMVDWKYRTDDGGTAPVGLYLVRLEALGEVITRTAIRVR